MFRKLHEPGRASCLIFLDGEPVAAEPGESVAAVLLRQENISSRTTAMTGSKRAPYCMMGVCFDCLAQIDGAGIVQTCLTLVRDGMRVTRAEGKRDILERQDILDKRESGA
jgi:D-hydroxyproline dehydrogenase subunit gamma